MILPVSSSPVRSVSCARVGGTTTVVVGCQQPPFVTRVAIDFESNPKMLDIKPFNELPISGQVTATVVINGNMVAVGGLDKEIRLLTSDGVQVGTFTGHTGGIISLATHGKRQLISGSWDGSCKIWDLETYQCVQTLDGLENGVNVLSHPSGAIVTASTGENQGGKIVNSKLRVYKYDISSDTYCVSFTSTPHDGPIRSLALPPSPAPDCPVVTVGNDGLVKLNEVIEGVGNLLTLPTTDAGGFLLGVDTNFSVDENGMEKDVVYDIISVSEQGDLYVHNTDVASESVNTPIQIIRHPTTIWDVAVVPGSGDVITGCHDGKIRIYTRLSNRVADEETIALNEKRTEEARQSTQKGPSAEEIAKYPDWDLRASVPAKGDKSVQTFRKGKKGIAAQWDASSGSWVEMGEIVSRPGNKEEIDGVAYDHVLPVEIDTAGGGTATLKLGYNVGDNPFVSAQQFIDKYELPQGHLAQVADHIRQTVGQDNTPTIDMNGASDSATVSSLIGAPESAMEFEKTPTYNNFPPPSMTIFSAGEDKISKIVTKAKEVLPALSSSDTALLDGMCATIKESSRYHTSTISEDEFNNIPNNLLPRCSLLDSFPLLDILRLGCLHPSCSKLQLSFFESVSDKVFSNLQSSEVDLSSNVPLPMLSFRLFCNLLKIRPLWTTSFWTDEARIAKIVSLGCDTITRSTNKNVKSSVATFALNYCLLPEASRRNEEIIKLLKHIVGKDSSTPEDQANATKGLVAIGTLLVAGVAEAKAVDIKATVKDCKGDSGVKAEVETALSA